MSRAQLIFLLVVSTASSPGLLHGLDPEATFRTPPVAGEPGQEVALEFRVSFGDPLYSMTVSFDLPGNVGVFKRVEVLGTASAHAFRSTIFNPEYRFGGYQGYLAGVDLKSGGRFAPIDPGDDVLVLKAVFGIHADAPLGDHDVHIENVDCTIGPDFLRSARVDIAGDSVFKVLPPRGPRPVGGLACAQSGEVVSLSWAPTEPYDTIAVRRNQILVATLEGSARSYEDRPSTGSASYQVIASRGGTASLPASCDLLVQPVRPAPIVGFTCVTAPAAVSLSWTNGAPYDSIDLYRNGRVVAKLPGTSQSHSDPFTSSLFTVYSLKGTASGVETVPATCFLNESSNVYVMAMEEVHADPGDEAVPVRLFGTNPDWARAFSFGLRVDPALARIRELTLEDTWTEANHSSFLYQPHVLHEGETAAGVEFGFRTPLPPGADRHLLTLLLDILPNAPAGVVLPVQLGNFGDPPAGLVFTVNVDSRATSKRAEGRDGAILIGDSPVPPVSGASAEAKEEPVLPVAGGGAVPVRSSGILLRWTNTARYSSIRIQRDGKQVAEIGGSETSHLDQEPGPGVHRYRIVALDGARESFPAVVTSRPGWLPGTFLRGDASSDRRVNIADPIMLVSHLFKGGPQPSCLDAADADDSGRVDLTDVVAVLYHLFLGAGPLPEPGTQGPWFDPTEDALPCG